MGEVSSVQMEENWENVVSGFSGRVGERICSFSIQVPRRESRNRLLWSRDESR